MNEDTRWKLKAGVLLIALSLLLYLVHYLIFADAHHLFIFFVSDLAFIPLEVLIVTLIIDQMLESREKQRRMEKLNIVIGTFFSTIGTPLLALISRTDAGLDLIKSRLVIGEDWKNPQFSEVQECFKAHSCSISMDRVDPQALRDFLTTHENFLLRIMENPMVFEHESFTDLLLALDHLTKELNARGDLSAISPEDRGHLSLDIQRVYTRLIPEWLRYMEYLKDHYPYLFSLAMRTNPFDDSARAEIRK
jgi:hypothetical protein